MAKRTLSAFGLLVLFAAILGGCSSNSPGSSTSRHIAAIPNSPNRTFVVLSKNLDPTQQRYPVVPGTAVYAVPRYEVRYMVGQQGFEDSLYGTIHVSRTSQSLLITDSDGRKLSVPLTASITKANPAFAFIPPGGTMPAVVRGLIPVTIAR